MNYVCGRSSNRIIHRDDCRYVKMIPERNRKYFETAEEARFEGYSCCKYCSGIWKYVAKEKPVLDNYCEKTGLNYFFNRGDGFLNVYSRHDIWKIIVSGPRNYIFLYHKNTKNLQEKTMIPGFHSQKAISPTILGYLKYINDHDEYVGDLMHEKHKKSEPRKGTKRYRKMMHRQAKKVRRNKIRNVLDLIDKISAANG